MKKLLQLMCLTVFITGLNACKPGSPKETDKYKVTGFGEPLTNEEYNDLTPLQQYQVANRLLATFYKGVPAKEFFDVSTLNGDPKDFVVREEYQDFIKKVQKALNTPLENKQDFYVTVVGDEDLKIDPKYNFSSNRKPLEFPLAYMYELPLSDEFYARWMAYKLTNTILFSPAEEIDSAMPVDVETIYANLSAQLLADASVRDIIYAHEISQTNWRRFRSPEDNTREMIEIFLGLFDRDADVPKAAKACKNWYLTDEDEGYLLKHEKANNNTETVEVLDGYYVTTCEDFMKAVSSHPLIMPRMTTVLIDHLFDVDYDAEKRSDLIDSVIKSNPRSFKDLFNAIIFSKVYLMDNERPMYMEENFFNLADRIYWHPHPNFFRELAENSVDNMQFGTNLLAANQPSMTLKLGRWPSVPLDSLGFSYYHRAIRQVAMLDQKTNSFNANDQGWSADLINGDVEVLRDGDFINYLFVAVAGRTATQTEIDTLLGIFESLDASRTDQTLITMDYISRLPSTYFFNAVK